LSPESLVGRTIGHYAVQGPLGSGGMGIVYRAVDVHLGRPVALKVLPADVLADPDRKRRFVTEARAASALNHPNIVTIYDIDRDAGVDFIAMEFVAGRTLDAIIPPGGLPVDRALPLACSIADALAAAHAAGVVHRDLKPANVIVSPEGRVKILDFGLAKLVEPSGAAAATVEAVTATGLILGTAPYMSPEQASGLPVDARSDIFSFGALLYEMLAGHRAFRADSQVGILAAVLRDSPPPLPGVPPQLASVVSRCLGKRPEERFQNAADLKAALEASLAPAPALARDTSVAVLPFVNMSASKECDYLCEGLAEEIINALTPIPGLRVVARTSAFVVGRMNLDVREIGARLGVSSVLEGSVRLAGSRVRVTAQLVQASDGSHLWSERYDREMADIFALEDEIAGRIAARLRGDLAKQQAGRSRQAVDPAAYHAYLEGRYHFARGTPDSLARARACYERATALDPAFALAFDGTAELFWFFGFFGVMPPRDAFSVSTWHVLRALELDDSLAESHALLGMLRKELDYNWPEVQREVDRARALNAASPLVRMRYAISALMPVGRLDEAVAELEAVVASDPLSIFMRWWLAITLLLRREPEAVEEQARHMLELDEGHFLGHWTRGIALDLAGHPADAVAPLQKAFELSGGSALAMANLGYVLASIGRRDEARRLLDEAGARARAGYWSPMVFAQIHVGLGEWDQAFEWLDRAVEARDPLIMPIKSFYYLDPLRSDPRYPAVLRKMNLEG
jgi:TolB-like protein/predicted Ser/Thr protein kinase